MVVLDVPVVNAQQRGPLITTSVGVIRNLQTTGKESKFSIYPEIQFSARILNDIWNSTALDGSVHIGGWSEGELSLDDLPDNGNGHRVLMEAHQSLLLGARLGLTRMFGKSYVSFTTGLSAHSVNREWSWALTSSSIIHSSKTGFYSVETGLRLQQPVSRVLYLGIDTNVYWYLSGSNYGVDPRLTVTFNASYVVRR